MRQLISFKNLVHLDQLSYQHLLQVPFVRSFSSNNKIIYPKIPIAIKHNISIRNMSRKDLNLVFKWAEKEGWNPGQYEIEPLYAADPSGYYILDVDGEPTASLAAVKHTRDFAFLGLFMVIPSRRGEGFGAMLWDIVTRKIEFCSSVGLNAVIAQIERYSKSGFSPSFLNTRWRGSVSNLPSEKLVKYPEVSITDQFSFGNLIAYDNKIFTTPRTAFLTQWLKMPESHALVALDSESNIIDYGVISRTMESNSYKIAPLLANNQIIADKLYRNLCSFVGNNAVVAIDISEVNPFASTMIEQFKLEKVFDTMRMYKGTPPETDLNKVVGLTSLEIGN